MDLALGNDGHGDNDGCRSLVQADEPVVMVDNPVQADEAAVAPSMASVELHHQWKSHSLMVRAGNPMAWSERQMEWSPFTESMPSVQDRFPFTRRGSRADFGCIPV